MLHENGTLFFFSFTSLESSFEMAAIEETWDNWRNNEGVIGKLRFYVVFGKTFLDKGSQKN